MAKWIYERWQPTWPEATGGSSSIPRIDVWPLNFDGTEGDRVSAPDIPDGQVFRYQESYYMKVASNQRVKYLDGKPTPIKDTLIDTIEAEEGTYPDDGVHSDQLYYVKLKPVFPTMRILRDGQWTEVETGYVLKDGVWKPIEEIYKLQGGQWVQA